MTRSNRLPALPVAPRRGVSAGDPIRPGFWIVRERLGSRQWGPPLPAAIMWMETVTEPGEPQNAMHRSGFYAAFVGGEPVSLYDLRQDTAHDVERIFRTERVISRDEYDFQLADLRWVREYSPSEPQANPRKPIDLLSTPPPF